MIVVANWKANIVHGSQFTVRGSPGVEIVIAAPFPMLKNGAQDVSQFPPGAYTGEVPAELLFNLGVKFCLIGHSERRKFLGETTEAVGLKMQRLLDAGVMPIVCAQAFEEIPKIAQNLSGDKFLVMFEPFEAISKDGQFNAIPPEKVLQTIKDWREKLPQGVKFLYGGSVNANNVADYLGIVDGFVIGHASLDIEEFNKIIEICSLSGNS